MNYFRPLVIYGEDSLNVSSFGYHSSVRGGVIYEWRYRYTCGDPWKDRDALILFY